MPSRPSAFNRRQFLQALSTVALGGTTLTDWGTSPVFANTGTDDYRALVCVFMFGGMDHNDFVLPYDEIEYDQLRAVRSDIFDAYATQASGQSRDRTALLPLTPLDNLATEGRQYAVPQEMADMRALFDEEDLLFVGSVGPLIEPTNRLSYEAGSVALPPSLFSHNDQQNYWQGLAVEGAQTGWGGRFVDALRHQGQLGQEDLFASISTAGNSLFSSGEDTSIFQVASDSISGPEIEERRHLLGYSDAMDTLRTRLAHYFRSQSFNHTHFMASDAQALQSRALTAIDRFGSEYNGLSPFTTSFPSGFYGIQFQRVANAIRASRALGARRQIFFIGAGGFDTHSNQASDLPWRQASLSTGLRAFSNALKEVGLWDNVTTFSGADFGRTLVANGSGTDHGWGAHHFVAGGSVRGRRLIGRMPQYNPDGLEYTESRGRLIPSVSIEQYSASLGTWLGVDDTTVNAVLPNLSNFVNRDLDLFQV